MKKYFIITIDTEGDNLWNVKNTDAKIRGITNKNAEYIVRFQELCEKYNFIPTYLTNYEMSNAQPFIEMATYGNKYGCLEIGMHMHAWNSPPYYPLKFANGGNNSYLGEYPKKIIRDKLCFLYDHLCKVFQAEITSHRGGRWYLNDYIIKCLEELGIFVDCSITPKVTWRDNVGYTKYSNGRSWSIYKDKVCKLKYKNIFYGKCNIIEVPMTIRKNSKNEKIWMRPNGKNLKDLLWLIDDNYKSDCNYMEFMLHSSELMPGGSPTFKNTRDIERLYDNLENLFKSISEKYIGISLSDFARKYIK
ncbi:hypothetical protein KQI69_00095 [Eubacterium sp. MSJ-13]|uniref:hypothetical protein n=1 Tax=Eubacterium sp. MSJ-13 TaxID=2841513 RepID=UPI001C0F9ABF|nr:hypothetical protein [Eubacterium sp. MSJ-13]MBU5477604.1 hypothetical protein [Eubacterium sp. MSJ-13]